MGAVNFKTKSGPAARERSGPDTGNEVPMQVQFTDDYIVDPETGCWTWQKYTRKGYGRCMRDGRLQSAHIWYWEQKHGPKPAGLDLDHTCHNGTGCAGGHGCIHRRCVNPDHLELATRSENVRRGAHPKLTAEQVVEICARPRAPLEQLAAAYGVTRFNIAAIRAGKTWREVASTPHEARITLGPPARSRTATLTEAELAEIKAAPRYYGSGRELAHRYGVSDQTISTIRSGRKSAGIKVG